MSLHPHRHTNSTTGNIKLPAQNATLSLGAAFDYYDRGWSVIPLTGKRPALISWREFQSRRATVDQLKKWFGDSPVNVGIVTGGVSRLTVVDCDTLEDVRYWQERFPETPLSVRTGGGGAHFYYRYPQGEPVRNRTGLFGRKIDLRGEGGYVVAPPSCHPNGNLYAWHSGGAHKSDNLPLLLPHWIAREGVPCLSQTHRPPVRKPESYIRRIRAVAGQRGHDQTFRAACILRDAGLNPEEALCELIVWNETHASPPWTARELLHKVQSAFSHRAATRDDPQAR